LDAKRNFSHGNLQEKMYLLQSLGYEIQRVCKFKKAIYRRKQSSSTRFDKFSPVVPTMA